MPLLTWGEAFLVNTITEGDQRTPDAIATPDGGFRIAWAGVNGSEGAIFVRTFTDAGSAAGLGDTLIASSPDQLGNPDISAFDNGDLLVTYHEFSISTKHQRAVYGADGVLRSLFTVTVVPSTQDRIDTATSGTLGLIATVDSSGTIVAVGRYTHDPVTRTIGFLSLPTVSAVSAAVDSPDLARLSDGTFAMVWRDGQQVLLRSLDAGGVPVGVPVVISSSTGDPDTQPEVMALSNGGILVTYTTLNQSFPGGGADVWGRIVASDGSVFLAPFLLNSGGGDVTAPVVTPLADGGFAAFWGNGTEIRGQMFDELGARRGGQVVIADGVAPGNGFMDAETLADGRILLTWASADAEPDFDTPDGSGLGILAQIFDPRDGLVQGSAAADRLNGNFIADQIDGFAGADTLLGLGGDDLLRGGKGGDFMIAGGGDDVLYGGAGGDELSAGPGEDTLYGNAGADTLSGGAGRNTLRGGTGDDQLQGQEGNDSMLGGAGGDELFGGPDDDVLDGADGDDFLAGGEGDDQIFDGPGADLVIGEAGDDGLFGGPEANTLAGGPGDDAYLLEGTLNAVTELAGEGNDTIFSPLSVDLSTLAPQVENLFFNTGSAVTGVGNALANRIAGGSGGDKLSGGASGDTIEGASGNDTLDGGEGNDSLVGGTDDDLYRVDSALDVVVELAGEGQDRIEASVSVQLFAFAPQVENLTLTGTAGLTGGGNALANRIVGNEGANNLFGGFENDTIEGGGGGDTLDGGPGADSLTGGPGDDLYRVDSASDVVVEIAGGGLDRVESTITLALFTYGQEVETLTLTGAANIDGTGNGKDNRITGNSGANVLSGGGLGNDTLVGGAGNDTLVDVAGADSLTGGGDADVFRFQSAPAPEGNVISDFVTGIDQIELDDAFFAGMPVGLLAPSRFVSGAAPVAGDADDRLLYNTTTGSLRYDPDGNGAAPSVPFVTIQGAPTIAAFDFEGI